MKWTKVSEGLPDPVQNWEEKSRLVNIWTETMILTAFYDFETESWWNTSLFGFMEIPKDVVVERWIYINTDK